MTEATNNEFSACDMATAAAQGFRDGVASVTAPAQDERDCMSDHAPRPSEVPYPPSKDIVAIRNSYGPMSLEPHEGEPVEHLYGRYELRDYGTRCIAWDRATRPAQTEQRADVCDECGGMTLGLSGETKWCCYCGAKLQGTTSPITQPAPTAAAPRDVSEFSHFLSAVMTAAGLVRHGRQSKDLSEYLGSQCMKYRLAAAPTPEPHGPYTKGDTDPVGDCDKFEAGIHVDEWFQRIVVYGDSPEDAEQLRDVVLARLARLNPAPVEQSAMVVPEYLRVQVCKLGRLGAAFDAADTHYAYTYTEQPDNVGAMRLGRAAASNGAKSHGDGIDRGLHLLQALQSEGFGVFQIAAAPGHVEVSRAMVVPEGWKLVPVEPTEEMLRNGWNAYVEDLDGGFNRFAKTYRAMLAAAPEQPAKEQDQ